MSDPVKPKLSDPTVTAVRVLTEHLMHTRFIWEPGATWEYRCSNSDCDWSHPGGRAEQEHGATEAFARHLVEQLAAAGVTTSDPAPCVMTHTPPYDFAECATHDEVFPLGGTCKFNGRDPFAVLYDEADEQRGLKVRAEMELETVRAENEQLRSFARQAREFLRWQSGSEDDYIKGARVAHRWWHTCLGGALDDLPPSVFVRDPLPAGEVGTGAGAAGDPAQTEATSGVTRSEGFPEDPAQAHLPAPLPPVDTQGGDLA